MKKFVLAFAAVSLLATPAFSQSVGEKTGINALIGVAPTTEDFVKEVAISDMFELESSKLAEANAEDANIKAFATEMTRDHSATSTELKGLVSSGKVKVEMPTALDSSHQRKLDTLKGLKGAAFDKQYDSDQESAHKSAVSVFERYSKGGDNADLKAFAAKTLPLLQEHLKKAQDIAQDLK
jgi:putative membrane protein